MKFSVLSVAALAALAAQAHAATFQCRGVQGSTGAFTLNLSQSGLKAKGTFNDKPLACKGDAPSTQKQFSYFELNKTATCPGSYIRVFSDMKPGTGGLISMVSRSGGDNHDWSGYDYQSFWCQ